MQYYHNKWELAAIKLVQQLAAEMYYAFAVDIAIVFVGTKCV